MPFITASIVLSRRDWVGQVSKRPTGVVNMYLASHVFLCSNVFISLMSLSWKGSITDVLWYAPVYYVCFQQKIDQQGSPRGTIHERHRHGAKIQSSCLLNLIPDSLWKARLANVTPLCEKEPVNESLSSTESHGSVFRQVITNQPDLIRHVLFNDNVNYAMRLF